MGATVKKNRRAWMFHTFLLLFMVQSVPAQKPGLQKTISFPSCSPWKLNVYGRNVNLNFKEFSNYVNQCCKGSVIRSDISVQVTFTKDSLPCCNAVIISDSVMASIRQMLQIKDCIMSYPKLKEGILYRIGETRKCAEFIISYHLFSGAMKVSSNNLVEGKPKK
jgi:hypothetical protein